MTYETEALSLGQVNSEGLKAINFGQIVCWQSVWTVSSVNLSTAQGIGGIDQRVWVLGNGMQKHALCASHAKTKTTRIASFAAFHQVGEDHIPAPQNS